MLDVSYAQPRESRGVAHKALSVLMVLVLALGLCPIAPAGQAWAAEGDKLELKAGDAQNTITADVTVLSGSYSKTLAVSVDNFVFNSKNYVQNGYDMSSFTEAQCDQFKVKWYDGSVADANLKETNTLKWYDGSQYYTTSHAIWNSGLTYTPESLRTAEDGTYKFYAVASYDGITSEPFEFTVTKGESTPTTSSAHAITVEKTGEGTVGVSNSVMGGTLTEATSGTSVEVITDPSANYKLGFIQVTDANGTNVSSSVGFSTDANGYRHTFTMPDYAVKIVVEFTQGVAEVTRDITFKVTDGNGEVLWANYDNYTISVVDSEGNAAPVSSIQSYFSPFTLTVGKTYTYTVEYAGHETLIGDVEVTEEMGSEYPLQLVKTGGAETVDITFEVKNELGDKLWSDYDYTITVTDADGTSMPSHGGWDTNVFDLSAGETYTYTITKSGYKTVTGTVTPDANGWKTVKVQLEKDDSGNTGTDPTDNPTNDPTLTLVVKPAKAAQYVQLYNGDSQLTLTDGKVSIPAKTEIEVSFQTYGTDYSPKSVEVTGATISTYGGAGYWFDMPSEDAVCTVKLSGGTEEIDVPTATKGLTYTGAELTGVADDPEGRYTVEGGKATAAGTHTATVTAAEGYEFADGEETATVEWSIARAKIAAAPSVKAGLKYTGAAQVGVNYRTGLGYTVAGRLSGANAGSYVATATPDKNHTWANGSTSPLRLSWSIAPGANTVKAKKSKASGNFKAKSLKKKAATVALPKVTTTSGGKVTWSVSTKDKKKVLTLKNGKVQVKKGARKGTYTMKLTASVKASGNYAAGTSAPVTVTVKVK